MLDFIIQSVTWTIVIYILFNIARIIIYYWILPGENKGNKDNKYIIVTVNNGEKYIEGYLRLLIYRIRYGKEKNIKKILIIDFNSKDDTKRIIEKFEKDYEFIKLIDLKKYKDETDLKAV